MGRFYFIKKLINQYYHQSRDNNQLGRGLNQYVFLPSDPDELVNQLKLLYFDKVGGNDIPQLNEQVVAIVDKLLEYECITTNQHQNIQSTFDSRNDWLLSQWVIQANQSLFNKK